MAGLCLPQGSSAVEFVVLGSDLSHCNNGSLRSTAVDLSDVLALCLAFDILLELTLLLESFACLQGKTSLLPVSRGTWLALLSSRSVMPRVLQNGETLHIATEQYACVSERGTSTTYKFPSWKIWQERSRSGWRGGNAPSCEPLRAQV